jgi:uncharacterized RDD family membrane protein YckC
VKKRNASLFRRLAAILYDWLLLFAVLMIATLPFVAVRGGDIVEAGDNTLYQLWLLFVIYLFFTFFWWKGGQTLGARTWRMRVEAADGMPPSFGQASLRFVAAAISLIPLGLGFIWQLWDKDRLTWHDRASGTQLMYYPKE